VLPSLDSRLWLVRDVLFNLKFALKVTLFQNADYAYLKVHKIYAENVIVRPNISPHVTFEKRLLVPRHSGCSITV